jgi:hypothetical protein
MIQISDLIQFDKTKSLDEQSLEFLEYAQSVFSQIDFVDMSALKNDNTCTWTIDQDGLHFTAKRVFINPSMYSVKEHIFNVEIL